MDELIPMTWRLHSFHVGRFFFLIAFAHFICLRSGEARTHCLQIGWKDRTWEVPFTRKSAQILKKSRTLRDRIQRDKERVDERFKATGGHSV